ncbi:AzlC family ABC transporter permease [Desulfovibrio inopinatus]|uniref:AzlC family ABC transporter permease n=1 Tax=Desulfovibrio inopinatus TaxID=102109 RepID=UPI0004049800|nr:AzlC family ABC transporter permease [Desulfovibrio inopinatus]
MHPDFLRGIRANLPFGLSAGAYGSVLGILAAQKGLGWVDIAFMNTAVFAGSAQFVMVDMWGTHLPVLEMTLAVLVINLRYLLIGASLASMFATTSLGRKIAMMHLVADENWASTMVECHKRPTTTTWFLFGGGVCIYLCWSAGTLAGVLGGAAIAHPERYALDFAFCAVFTALAVSLWRGKQDVLPWLVAGLLAVLAEHVLPGKWYIVIGGLGGAITAMCIPDRDETAHTASTDEQPHA